MSKKKSVKVTCPKCKKNTKVNRYIYMSQCAHCQTMFNTYGALAEAGAIKYI